MAVRRATCEACSEASISNALGMGAHPVRMETLRRKPIERALESSLSGWGLAIRSNRLLKPDCR